MSACRDHESGSAVPGVGIAIVGMACTFPGARNLRAFWRNIVSGVDAITDAPPQRWDPEVFYDPAKEGGIYCKRGGYLGTSFTFNPLKCGTMPRSIDGAEPEQFLVLRAVYEALEDAGYVAGRRLPGEKTAVILGRGNYLGSGVTGLVQRGMITEQTLQILRALHPEFSASDIEAIRNEMQASLPSFAPDSAPGLIPNIVSGRVANRLDLMGPTYTVDAACASSLIATDIGVRGLLTGQYDAVLAGGVHLFADVSFLHVFCAMGAFSRSAVIRPYDNDCDGTISGEGVGIMMLKRIADAERDGDRVYAVIRGVGTSSDGKALSVTAPRVEGEVLALHRAYEMAGIDPQTVELIEGHGTGTPVGDPTEIEALRSVFGPRSGGAPSVALGSIKSMIGHAMPAAGAAAMIKTALSLYHGVLPPTLNCRRPHRLLSSGESRFYVNAKTRPWLHAAVAHSRRAGVNAFGFGGVNAHVVLEEHSPRDRVSLVAGPNTKGTSADHSAQTLLRDWDTELFVVAAENRASLAKEVERLRQYAIAAEGVALCDLAFTINGAMKDQAHRLCVVASSLADLAEKLAYAGQRLTDPACKQIKDGKGIYYLHESPSRGGKVAFLFPGLGAQYVNLMSDLCMHFPEVRGCFENADRAMASTGDLLSGDIFPPPAFTDEEDAAQELRLARIERANPAVMTANGAMFVLLDRLGLRADMMTGHSSGEWVVMPASGMVTIDEFVSSMSKLGDMWRKLNENEAVPHRVMLAVGADRETVAKVAAEVAKPIYVANDNCKHQVVVVAEPDVADLVISRFRAQGVFVERLPYRHGYHTGEFTYVTDALRDYFSAMKLQPPKADLYSCTTAKKYPQRPREIVNLLAHTFARPLLFRDTVEAMYADGARIFVEVGPRGNLTAFVDDILRGRPHSAITTNQHRKPGITSLHHALAQLAALHVPLALDALYEKRGPRRLTLDAATDRSIDESAQPGAIQISLCSPRMSIKPRDAAPRLEMAEAVIVLPRPPGNGSNVPAPPSPKEDMPVAAAALPLGTALGQATASVVQDHFRLMEEFLQTNEQIMQAYLVGAGTATSSAPVPSTAPKHTVGLPTAPIAEARNRAPEPPSLALVHQSSATATAATVELPLSAVAGERASVLPARDPRSLESVLLGIVSERTGYPPEMLDLDLDMEADLGIDSIKRVEILGALQQSAEPQTVSREIDMEEVARLKTLRQIVNFLNTALPGPGDGKPPGEHHATTRWPFDVRVISHAPGQSLVVERLITVDEDLYLHDHCFDPYISDADPERERLCIVPLTVGLEMMAETAARLMPDLRVVSAKNVQAAKWIEVEPGGPQVTIAVKAERRGDREVYVTLSRKTADSGPAQPLAEAMFGLAKSYPSAPAPVAPDLENRRRPGNTAAQMYAERRMFHGPRFRGVASLDAVGDNGLLANLEVLPLDNLLRSAPKPRFTIDPFLLDAAGQLVGYWPVEYLSEGFVLFPIRIAELTLYRENLAPGDRAECRLNIADVSKRQLRANMDVVAPDGSLWMRITGWEDWRFYWDKDFYNFWRYPNKGIVSERIELPVADGDDFECRKMTPFGEMGSSIWENLWAHLIMSRDELEQYRRMGDGPRRTEWIFGRAAAKDAVRKWIKRRSGLDLYPADVIITQDSAGKPAATGHWLAQAGEAPQLSIAHKGNVAIAVAGPSPIGIDLETIAPHEEGFERLAFTGGERELLDRLNGSTDRCEWMTRAWCAKEAAGKAAGNGLSAGPKSYQVRSLDAQTGDIIVAASRESPNEAEPVSEFAVKSFRDGQFVIAIALCERRSSAAV